MKSNGENFSKSLIGSFIGIGSLLIFQSFSGTVIFIFLIFLIPLSIYSLIVIFKYKNQRQIRSTKLFLWLLAFLLSFSYNFYINESIRTEANNLVTKIESYKLNNGQLPQNLQEIGVLEKDIDNKIIVVFYYNEKRGVNLSYTGTYMDMYIYDFKEKIWNITH